MDSVVRDTAVRVTHDLVAGQDQFGPKRGSVTPHCSKAAEIVDKRPEVSPVGQVHCVQVSRLVVRMDDRRKLPGLDAGIRHQQT